MMQKNKTVAIIGGGLAGLSAARLLLNSGVAVKLFEANAKLGGCCATTRIGGYTFSDGAVYLALPGLLDRLFQKLELDRQQLVPLRRVAHLQTSLLPDGTVVTFGDGVGISVEGNEGAAATGKAQEELQRFLEKWEPVLRFISDDILIHPLSLSRFLFKGWPHLLLLRGTVAAHLHRDFSHDAVRAALAGTLLYNGVPPDKMPAISLLGLASLFRDGLFLSEGGMGSIPGALEQAVRSQGGEIHLNSGVRRILVRNGRVRGVEIEGQGVVEADAVISSTSAMHTYAELLSGSDAPARMIRKVRRAILSRKGFVLQLGLSNRINARSHVHAVLPWLGEQSQVFVPDKSQRWLNYMVPTVTMPELAPQGGSIIEVFPSIGQEIPPEDWSEERKEEVAAQAISRLKDFHEINIAERRMLSPREFQDDAHLYAGALYGLSPAGGPPALFSHQSPVRGLYLAGQTTWPGFGVTSAGMSGVFAAESLIENEMG